MKFKKNWKRFWTLDRHCAEGFTLVELIVVIAILAILAGVAVPAYSGYVEKANIAADQTLAAEVANALLLQYYSDPAAAAGGYVILSADGAEGDGVDGVGTKAMDAAFGEGWTETAALKYDGWGNAGSMMSYVLNMDSDAVKTVANSTYLTKASTDGMLNALTTMTGIVTQVIDDYEGNVENKLSTLLGEDFVTTLNKTGVTSDDDAYTTVISNLMVGHFANAVNGADLSNLEEVDDLTASVVTYATLYAYAESIGDTETMALVNKNLAGIQSTSDIKPATIYAGIEDEGFISDFMEFYNNSGSTDNAALQEIMGALGKISGSYTDAKSLSDANLYSSDAVSNQANEYVNAVKSVASMDKEALAKMQQNVANGSVMIICYGGGVFNPLAN